MRERLFNSWNDYQKLLLQITGLLDENALAKKTKK